MEWLDHKGQEAYENYDGRIQLKAGLQAQTKNRISHFTAGTPKVKYVQKVPASEKSTGTAEN